MNGWNECSKHIYSISGFWNAKPNRDVIRETCADIYSNWLYFATAPQIYRNNVNFRLDSMILGQWEIRIGVGVVISGFAIR